MTGSEMEGSPPPEAPCKKQGANAVLEGTSTDSGRMQTSRVRSACVALLSTWTARRDYTHIHTQTYIYIYIYIYTYVWVYIHIHIYVYIYIYIYIRICICVYVYIYVCMYTCTGVIHASRLCGSIAARRGHGFSQSEHEMPSTDT